MSEDELIEFIQKTSTTIGLIEEADECSLSEYECEERYAEMLDEIGEKN